MRKTSLCFQTFYLLSVVVSCFFAAKLVMMVLYPVDLNCLGLNSYTLEEADFSCLKFKQTLFTDQKCTLKVTLPTLHGSNSVFSHHGATPEHISWISELEDALLTNMQNASGQKDGIIQYKTFWKMHIVNTNSSTLIILLNRVSLSRAAGLAKVDMGWRENMPREINAGS